MGSTFRLTTKLLPLFAGCYLAQGFSLMGPAESWQTADLGYSPPGVQTFAQEGDVGFPVALGEEFRVNIPVITYGFDQSFLEYFGVEGVKAVDAAFKAFNDLAPVSNFSSDLTEFPKATARVNFTAQRLSLLDVKSITMGLIIEQLGLAAPERFVWTLRQRNEDNGFQMFNVISRNYDPVTLRATPYVNDSLYTYLVRPFVRNGAIVYWDAQEISLDAAEPNVSLAAYAGMNVPTIDGRVGRQIAWTSYGSYYTGLTRDDAGGLRYLYHPENRNVEVLPALVGPLSTTPVTKLGSSSGGSGNWAPFTGTGFATGNTNAPGGGVTIINQGVRPGLDKIQFMRVDMDPLLSQFTRPLVFRYTDTVMTNGVTRTQQVEKQLARPDIVLTMGDLGTWPAPFAPFPWIYSRGKEYNLLGSINGISGNTFDAQGPGLVEFNTGGLFLFNRAAGGRINLGSGTTEQDSITTFVWGSFDGSTNAPVVYPAGRLTLRDLERVALSGN